MGAEEKRLYPRLSLDLEDGYFGQFKTKTGEKVVAAIVNLSAGGINMAVSATYQDKITEGETLLFQNLAGGTSLTFLGEVKGEIRWIKKLNIPKYISVGIRFTEISEESRQQLSKFVDTERRARGQYS